MQSVRQADRSIRKNQTAQGKALMQDLAKAGQTVLGNKYPDSGTAGRLMDAATLASAVYNPAIPLSLFAGGLLYTQPMQKALSSAVTNRPEFAGLLANIVRQSSPAFALPGMGLLQSGK